LKLESMAEAARRQAKRDAAERLAVACLDAAEQRR
jgi:hypothetical protein